MITILGIKVSYEALIFFGLFIGSEVIAASKLREIASLNSLYVLWKLSSLTVLKMTRSNALRIPSNEH